MSSTTTHKTQVPKKWDATKIPSLQGKVAIVTGANSGIGYETALELARKGADVVLACRSEERGKAAEKKIQAELAANEDAGKVEFAKLDVSSLKSVKEFSEAFLQTHDRLDLLINNAGILAVPHALTADGVESQFATNHLGHFALTAQLFDLIKTSTPSRIVNVSSALHRQEKFNEDEIMTPLDKYSPMAVYSNTKLCNILFTKELDRRIKAAGIQGVSTSVAHPGLTLTNLTTAPASENGFWSSLPWKIANFMPFLFQSSPMGALPTLYAAVGPNVQGGDFFGPRGFMAIRGHPALEEPSTLSESKSAAMKLWTLSERLANLSFNIKK